MDITQNNFFIALKNFNQRKPRLTKYLKIAFIILATLIILRIALPHVIIVSANHWLKKQSIDSSIEAIELDLIKGKLSIINAKGFQKDNQTFNIGLASIHWQWRALTDKQIIINNIALADFTIGIHKHGNHLSVGGIQLLTNEATTKDSDLQNDINKPWSISLADIALNNIDVCYQEHLASTPSSLAINYCSSLKEMRWHGSINYDASKISEPALSTQGSLSIKTFELINNQLNRALLKIGSADIDELMSSTTDKAKIKAITINDFMALQRSNKLDDSTLSFTALTIQDSILSPKESSINNIKLTGLSGHVSINKDGSLEYDKWVTATATTDNKSTEKNTADDAIKFSLNKFIITSDKKILFTDNSSDTPLTFGLDKLSFETSPIQLFDPNNSVDFSLAVTTTKQATLELAGNIKAFAKDLSFETNGKLKGFDLRDISPITKSEIGHKIHSGQLDIDLDLSASKGLLDSKLSLALYQFNIKPEDKQSREQLDKTFGMPLNQTLVLLRDKDDSIHLDIPITGDTLNPTFDPMDAVIKATSKAATFTLITFYTPYGLIYNGGSLLFDLATAMNFEPVIFKGGLSELTEEHKAQLDTLTTLMTEKPQIHLTLCGSSNKNDLLTLYPDHKEKEKDKTKKITAPTILALKQLADKRQNHTKSYLSKKEGISHDRLILCDPEFNTDEETLSGVEINI